MPTVLIYFHVFIPPLILFAQRELVGLQKIVSILFGKLFSLEFLAKYSVNVKTMKSFLSSLARCSYGAGHKIFMHVIIGSGPCLRIRDPFSNEYLPPVFQISSNSGPICGGVRYY